MNTVRIDRPDGHPGLAVVTLDRPEKLNAINREMHEELQALCRELETDTATRVVIVTGAGRAFSAGADLGSRRSSAGARPPRLPAAALSSEQLLAARSASTMGNRTSAALEALPQVTIAAINGLAIGGAVVFLACLDIRLAARSAWFSIPEVELDIPLTWNALPRLMRELGPARTKELVILCERFTAEDAERWGFVNHVTLDEDLMPRALAAADRVLAMDPFAVAATKSATNALAQLMVPGQATWSDPELLLLARRIDRS